MAENNSETHNVQYKDESKKPMTDKERLELADKLDEKLDEWINSLEKKAYKDGWAEDNWEEEMEKHPFFMTKIPENTEDSPLLHGIQQLKYDENENTPFELAQNYKEDGNFNFKHKKYRMAVISYTEGLKRKCDDAAMNASLYNNRAAAQFLLGNLRSSLMDCKKCLELNPCHDKAELRAAECCLQLKKTTEAINFCDSYLKRNPDHEKIKQIKIDSIKIQKVVERDRRKGLQLEQKEEQSLKDLDAAIKSRGVKVEVSGDYIDVLRGMLEKPKLLEDGSLTWPVFFLYPEHSTSDFVQEFSENVKMIRMLEEVLTETPEWDPAGEYRADNLVVYYEGEDRTQLFLVDVFMTLRKIITGKGFVARDWRPAFLVFVKDSNALKNFTKNYTVMC